MTDPTFVKVNELSGFSDIYKFQKEIDEFGKKKIFFDTANIISLIAGINDLYDLSRFNIEKFDSQKTLLLACVFRGWLGKIQLLPPHLQEFWNKRNDPRLFPENEEDEDNYLTDIWNRLGLDHLAGRNVEVSEETLERTFNYQQVKTDAVQRFKLLYLLKENSWRSRFLLLFKGRKKNKEQVLDLSKEKDFQISWIYQQPLFKSTYSLLNEKRPGYAKNNFMDALALYYLQEYLSDFKAKCHLPIEQRSPFPLFYSHQKHIVEVVKKLSKEKFQNESPFVYSGKSGNILVVQDTDFFLVDAIFQAGKKMDRFKNFEGFLQMIRKSDSRRIDASPIVGVDILEKDTELATFFKFFTFWWEQYGYLEVKQSLYSFYKREFNFPMYKKEYEKEILEMDKRMERDKILYNVLRVTYSKLRNFRGKLNEIFNSTGELSFDVYSEFSTRFAFPYKICKDVDDLLLKLHESHKVVDQGQLDEEKTRLVTYITYLVDKKNIDNFEKKAKLTSALAVLWIIGEYNLLDKLGSFIRKVYSKGSKTDVYPDYYLATLHAAAIMRNRVDLNVEKAEKILDCVQTKFGKENYKVWVSLSYVYYLIWKKNISIHEIPELLFPKDWKKLFSKTCKGYYEISAKFVKKAIDYLEDKLMASSDPKKNADRNRNFYYAVNNFVYFKTMNDNSKNFSSPELSRFYSILRNAPEGQFHERYHDTCARYLQRKAALLALKDPNNIDDYNDILEEALGLVDYAIRNGKLNGVDDQKHFSDLKGSIKQMKREGPQLLIERHNQRKEYLDNN